MTNRASHGKIHHAIKRTVFTIYFDKWAIEKPMANC